MEGSRLGERSMARIVVIEGLIGVGKTSLCRLLARERSARLVLEPADDNPFLASFYADPGRFAFPAQMFYLATRYAQQLSLRQGDLFTDLVVSDYIYAKDRLFAEETLNKAELELYDRFASLLDGGVPDPDFVLFLDAPTDVILERIRCRAISAEQQIPASYLDSLRNRYYAFWDRYEAAPVYVLHTQDLNYVTDATDATLILEMIDGWLAGTPHPKSPPRYADSAQQLHLF